MATSIRQRKLIGVLMAAALGISAFWVPAHAATSTEEQDSAAISRYLSQVPKGQTIVLDLTDPIMEAATMARYRLAGITPQSDPKLFEQLNDYKQRQLQLKSRGEPITVRSMMRAAGISDDVPQPYVQMLRFKGTDHLSYDVMGTAYAPIGDVVTGNQNRNLKITQQILEERAGNYVAITRLSTQNSNDPTNNFDIRKMPATSNETLAKPTRPVVGWTTMQYSEGATLVLATEQHPGLPLSLLKATAKVLNDPIHKVTPSKVAEPVIVCLNRANGSPGVCDYGPTYPGQPNSNVKVVFPVRGSVKYNVEMFQYGHGTGDSSPLFEIMLGAIDGGACPVAASSASIKDNFKMDGDGKGFTFNIPSADFGKPCYKSGTVLPFSLLVTSVLKDGGDFGQPYTIGWASNYTLAGGVAAADFTTVSPIEIQFGCVLEGTMVELVNAEVSEMPIEELRKGSLIAGKGGETLRVRSVTYGTDTDFMRIVAGDSTVFLTPGHPVRTRDGIIAASKVKIGDYVYDKSGTPVEVKEAAKQTMDTPRKVYNLVLEKENREDISTAEDAIFMAGGIQVGDNTMQGILAKKQ